MSQRIAETPSDIANCVSAFLLEGDMEGILSMFHPQCKIYFPADQPPYIGKAGARQVFEDFIKMRPRIESNVVSEVIIGDTALLQANWRMIGPDGSVLATGDSCEVAKKLETGGWGYLIDCPDGVPLLKKG